MADIGSLNVNISTSGVSAFAASLNRMRSAAGNSNLGKVASETRAVGTAARSATKHTNGFGSSLLRIAKYRIMRSVIKSITQAFSTGVKDLYAYSEALNSADAAANKATMDAYSSSLLYLKNAAGAAAGPLLQALLPVVQQLVDWFVAGANAVNQFISALQGKSTFTKAVYTMTEFGDQTQKATGAAKELKKTVMGFDELNLLQVDNGRGGGGGASTPDYSKMFEEAEIDSTIQKISDKIKPLLEFITNNFSTILTLVGAIGLGMLAWKIGSGIAGLFGKLGSAVGSSGAGKTLSVTNTLKGLADIALIVGGLTAIVVAYGELRKIPGFDEVVSDGLEGLKTLFGGLSEIALPLAGFATGILALGKIGIATVTKGVVGFAEIIAGLGVVVVAIGELRKIDGFDEVIASGSEMLAGFGTTIGQFVGNLVGGFSEGITSGLPGIGKNLAGFMTNSKPFFEEMAKIDQSTVESALALAGVIVSLTGASILDGLTSWLTGGVDFGKFADQLPILGKGIKGFSDSVKGVSSLNVKTAANAALVIANLQDNLPRSGGWAQKIAGEKNLSGFADALPKLGKAIKQFSDSATGVSKETVEEASSAAKAIAGLQDNLPRTGGWAQAIAGEKNLEGFASALPKLGSAIKNFSDKVTGVSAGSVAASGNAAKSLAEFYNALPREGGVVATLAGERDLKTFVAAMPSIGTSIKAYAENIGTISNTVVTTSTNAALTLAKMYAYLPKSGGLAELVAGKSDLTSFAKALPALGTSIKNYANNVGNIDTATVTASANAASSIAKFAKIIPNDGGLVGLITGNNDIKKFAKGLEQFGTSFKNYADNIGDIDKDKVTTSTNAAKAVAEFAKIIPNDGGLVGLVTGNNDIGDFGKSLEKFGKSFANYATSVSGITNLTNVTNVTKAISSLADIAIKIKNAGAESTLTEFGNSLKSSETNITGSLKGIFSSDAGKSIGTTFGIGIASGIKTQIMRTTFPRLDIKVEAGTNGKGTAKIAAVDPNEEERLKFLYGYANGGFPDADLFMANENGVPELVGKIGNQTAVANTDQIIQGISEGVFNAMMAANSGTRGGQNNDIHVTLQLGEYELANAVVSALNNQTRRIGYSQLEGI